MVWRKHLYGKEGSSHQPLPHHTGSADLQQRRTSTCNKQHGIFTRQLQLPNLSSTAFGMPVLRDRGWVRHLLAAVSARFGLRSEPSTARSCRTPKYLPFPQPTSAKTDAVGRLCRKAFTCKEVIKLRSHHCTVPLPKGNDVLRSISTPYASLLMAHEKSLPSARWQI